MRRLKTPMGGEFEYEYDYAYIDPGNLLEAPTVGSKRIKSGVNVATGTWTYDYEPGAASSSGYDVTTVTQPDGIRQYYHVGYSSVWSGDIWRVGLRYAEHFFEIGRASCRERR